MTIVRKPVAGLSLPAFQRFVARAARAVHLHGEFHVLITSSRELQSLNRRFRGRDRPTDVLSFPSSPGFAEVCAGDIAISADIAAHNARALGHSPADEVRILALHGILHLAGYDHEQDSGAMARREKRLRRALGLPSTLLERNGDAKVKVKKGRSGNRASARKDAMRSSRHAR